MQLDRRTFLAGAGSMGVLGALGALAGCSPAAETEPAEAEGTEAAVEDAGQATADIKHTLEAFYRIIDIKSEYFLSTLRDILLSRYRSFFQVENVQEYRKYFIETTRKILNLEKEIDIFAKPDY
ncbi:MAG: twin-arginine translocation signal domain-containing protein, partial [Eggerthellaceae bacterium]|nr:twin-arginine translocation signal domain-containing protein [Eggerthellaceae bacterium]